MGMRFSFRLIAERGRRRGSNRLKNDYHLLIEHSATPDGLRTIPPAYIVAPVAGVLEQDGAIDEPEPQFNAKHMPVIKAG